MNLASVHANGHSSDAPRPRLRLYASFMSTLVLPRRQLVKRQAITDPSGQINEDEIRHPLLVSLVKLLDKRLCCENPF